MADDININLSINETLRKIQAGESGVPFQATLDTSGGQHTYKAVNSEIQKYLESQKATIISATQMVNLLTRGYKDYDSEIQDITKQLVSAQGETKKQLEQQLQEIQDLKKFSERKAPVGTEIHKLLELQEKGEIKLNRAVESAKYLLNKMNSDSKAFEELRTLVAQGDASQTQKNFERAFAQAQKMSQLKTKAGLTGGQAEKARAMTLVHDGKLYVVAGTTDWSKGSKIGDYKTTSQFHPEGNIIQTAVNANLLRAEQGRKKMPVSGKIVNVPTTYTRAPGRNKSAVYDVEVGSYEQIENMMHKALDILEGKQTTQGVSLPGAITGSTLPQYHAASAYYGGRPLSQLQKEFTAGQLSANKLRGIIWKGIEKEKTGGTYADLASRLFKGGGQFYTKEFVDAIYGEGASGGSKRTSQDSLFIQSLKDARAEIERRQYAQMEPGALSEYDTRHNLDEFKEVFGEWGAKQQEYAKYQLEDSDEANIGFYLEKFGDDLSKTVHQKDPEVIAHLLSRTYAASDVYDAVYKDVLSEINQGRGDEGKKPLEIQDILSEQQRQEYILSKNLRQRFEDLQPLDKNQPFSYIEEFAKIANGGVFPGQTESFSRLMSWMNRLVTSYPTMYDVQQQGMEDIFRQYGPGNGKLSAALRNPSLIGEIFEDKGYIGLTSTAKTPEEQLTRLVEQEAKTKQELEDVWDKIKSDPDFGLGSDDSKVIDEADKIFTKLLQTQKSIESLKGKIEESKEAQSYEMLTSQQEATLQKMKQARAAAFQAFDRLPAAEEDLGEPTPLPEYLTHGSKAYKLDTVYEPALSDDTELQQAFEQLATSSQEESNQVVVNTVQKTEQSVKKQAKKIKDTPSDTGTTVGGGMTPVQVFGRSQADLKGYIQKQILTDEDGNIIGKFYHSQQPKQYVDYGPYGDLQGWQSAFSGKTREEAEADLRSRFAARRTKESGELYANDEKTLQQIIDKVFGESTKNNPLFEEVKGIHEDTSAIKSSLENLPEDWNSEGMRQLFAQISGGSTNTNTFSGFAFKGSKPKKPSTPQQGTLSKDLNAYRKNTKLITDYQKEIESLEKTLATTPSMLGKGREAIEQMILMRTQDKQALIEENELMLTQGKLTQQEADAIELAAKAQRAYNSEKVKAQKGGAQSIFDVIKGGVKQTITRMFDYTGVYRVLNKIMASFQNVIGLSKELDTAMFNLRVVSGDSREEAQGLISDYNDLAKQLGATTVEIANAANEWMRQGYEAEQATKLITASTYLSKLGMIDAGQATQYLTSMIKGFKLEVTDAVEIVDKLTKLDMVSATSSGGLAEAMQNVASSAQLANVSMDKTLAYAATIIETTQRDESSVGMSLRTILARYGNVKAGAYSNMNLEATGDTDLENLNDVEKVLKKIGISIRSSATEFKSFEQVLDEVGDKWERLDSVSRNAIATAFAGQRQRESFLVLMNNMDRVEELAEISAEATGTATEKYSAYYETVEAATKRLQTAWENLSHSFEVSGVVKGMTNFFAMIVEKAPQIIKLLSAIATQMNAWRIPTLLKAGVNASGLAALKEFKQSNSDSKQVLQYRYLSDKQKKQQSWKEKVLGESEGRDFFGIKKKLNIVSSNIDSLVSALDRNTVAVSSQTSATKTQSTYSGGVSPTQYKEMETITDKSDLLKKTREPKFNLKNMRADKSKKKGLLGPLSGMISDQEDTQLTLEEAEQLKALKRQNAKTNAISSVATGVVSGVMGGIMQEGSTEAKAASGAVQGAAGLLGGIASIWIGPLGTMLGSVIGDVLGPIVADAVDKEANDRKKEVEKGQKQLDLLSSMDSSLSTLDSTSKIDQLSADDISSIRDIVNSIDEQMASEDSNLQNYLEDAFKAVGATEFFNNWETKLVTGTQEERRAITRALQLAKSEAETAAYESSMAEKKYAALTTAEAKVYYKKLDQAEVERAYIRSGVSEYSKYTLARKGVDEIIKEVAKQLEGVDLKGIRLYDSFGKLTEEADAYIRTMMKADDQMQEMLAGQTLTLQEAFSQKNTTLLEQFSTALGVSIEQLGKFKETLGTLTLGDLLAGMGETREKMSSYNTLLADFFSTGTISPENLENIIASFPDLINKIGEPQDLLRAVQTKVSQLGTQYVSAGISSWFSSEAVYEQFKEAFEGKEGFGAIFEKSNLLGNIKSLDEAKITILKMLDDDELKDKAQEMYDYIVDAGNAVQKELEYIKKQLEDTAELDAIMNVVDKNYEKQISALEEQKSVLEQINDQREYENRLIEAKLKLENAQNEKKKVWREGVGWVYEADTSAIADAQKDLENLENQKTIEELQAQIDELQAQRDYVADIPDRLELEQANENFKAWTDRLGLVNDDQLSVITKLQEVWTDLKTRSAELEGEDQTKGQFDQGTQKLAGASQTLMGVGGTAAAPAAGSAQANLQEAYEAVKKFDQSDNSQEAQTARTKFADALENYQGAYSEYIRAGGTASEEQEKLNALRADSDDLRFAPKWENIQLPGYYYRDGKHNFDVYASFEDATNAGGWKQGGMKDVVLLSPIQGRADKEGIGGFDDIQNSKYNGQLFLNTKGGDQLFWVYNGRIYRATRHSDQYKKKQDVDDSTYTKDSKKGEQNLTSADNYKWYATGTLSAPGGVSMVNDDPQYGLEGIITPQGTLTALPSKSGVVPADMTRNVWQLGEVAPNLIKQLVDINGKFNSPLGFGTDESFNVDHLDVHMVAQPGFDMDDFVRKLRAARDLSKHS